MRGGFAKVLAGLSSRFGGGLSITVLKLLSGLLHRFASLRCGLLSRLSAFGRRSRFHRIVTERAGRVVESLGELLRLRCEFLLATLLLGGRVGNLGEVFGNLSLAVGEFGRTVAGLGSGSSLARRGGFDFGGGLAGVLARFLSGLAGLCELAGVGLLAGGGGIAGELARFASGRRLGPGFAGDVLRELFGIAGELPLRGGGLLGVGDAVAVGLELLALRLTRLDGFGQLLLRLRKLLGLPGQFGDAFHLLAAGRFAQFGVLAHQLGELLSELSLFGLQLLGIFGKLLARGLLVGHLLFGGGWGGATRFASGRFRALASFGSGFTILCVTIRLGRSLPLPWVSIGKCVAFARRGGFARLGLGQLVLTLAEFVRFRGELPGLFGEAIEFEDVLFGLCKLLEAVFEAD